MDLSGNCEENEGRGGSICESEEVDDAKSERSWHCGCPYDPYPDDPFHGYDPPDQEYEEDYADRKSPGVAKHACRRRRAKSAIKKKKRVPKLGAVMAAAIRDGVAEADAGEN